MEGHKILKSNFLRKIFFFMTVQKRAIAYILRCIELMSSCERPCVQDGTSSRLLIELSLANSLTPGTKQGNNPIDLHMSIGG